VRPRRPPREYSSLLARSSNWGSVMHHIPFGRSLTFDPDTLKKLGETFDKAWAAIAGNFTGSSRDAARLQLATIILEFAADGDCNLLELKCRAIGAMRLPRAA
jgi:hypothetical protein